MPDRIKRPASIAWLAVGALLLAFAPARGEEGGLGIAGEGTPLRAGDRIVFVGDSITMQGGYVEMLAKALKEKQPKLDVKVTRYGLNGGRVPDVAVGKTPWGEAKPFARILDEDKPTLLVIYLGINDVMHSPGTSKEDFAKGLKDLIASAQAAKAVVVLATPAVNGEKIESNAAQKKLDEYAAISRAVAKDTSATLCDLRAGFIDYLAKNNPEKKSKGILTYDGIHMSETGNKLIAQLMSQSLVEAAKGRK
jgi:lysophospholipase L1-like esterase